MKVDLSKTAEEEEDKRSLARNPLSTWYACVMENILDRQAVARRGKQLEYFTIAWNSLEGLVAVVAGALAGSISLVGFGIDSFIEVTSDAVPEPWTLHFSAVCGKPAESALLERPLPLPAGHRSDRLRGS